MSNVTVCQILDQLEKTSRRLEKESILRQHKDNMLLREVFYAALDPYTNYGIVKFKKHKPVLTVNVTQVNAFTGMWDDPQDCLLASFLTNVLPKLAQRIYTGNAARAFVENAFAEMDCQLQKWCERILFHKLRTGTQAKTINKIWPKTICPFTVQLASVIEADATETGIKLKNSIDYPVFVEPKLDGLRLIAVKWNGVVSLFTRNGRVIETLPILHQFLTNAQYDNFVLDGEIMGADWNESASVVMSNKTMKDDANMAYHVFDGMNLVEWQTQNCKDQQGERRKKLIAMCDVELSGGPVKPTEISIIFDDDDLLNAYLKYLDEGYEGVMLKDINGMYSFSRTNAWRKLKPFTTYEGVIVGTYDGNVGSKREGKFGGFNVLFPNGVITNVGSGFSDAEKAEIDNNRGTWIGKIIEVKGQPPLTKDGRVRFPTKERYRHVDDVDPAVIEAYSVYTRV